MQTLNKQQKHKSAVLSSAQLGKLFFLHFFRPKLFFVQFLVLYSNCLALREVYYKLLAFCLAESFVKSGWMGGG